MTTRTCKREHRNCDYDLTLPSSTAAPPSSLAQAQEAAATPSSFASAKDVDPLEEMFDFAPLSQHAICEPRDKRLDGLAHFDLHFSLLEKPPQYYFPDNPHSKEKSNHTITSFFFNIVTIA